MNKHNNGGPAFPQPLDTALMAGLNTSNGACGMTLRDYFAIHASEDDVKAQAEIIRTYAINQSGFGILPDDWRTTARYMHADLMLKARSA